MAKRRLRKRIQLPPTDIDCAESAPLPMWNPPSIEHKVVDAAENRRYPQRTRHLPDYLRY